MLCMFHEQEAIRKVQEKIFKKKHKERLFKEKWKAERLPKKQVGIEYRTNLTQDEALSILTKGGYIQNGENKGYNRRLSKKQKFHAYVSTQGVIQIHRDVGIIHKSDTEGVQEEIRRLKKLYPYVVKKKKKYLPEMWLKQDEYKEALKKLSIIRT